METPNDLGAPTFLSVPVVLVAIALISGLVPAFRASWVDPMRVLAADG